MSTFHPHFEILPEEQLRMWPKLGAIAGLGFVLYGGTAIALRLGHRASVDFDFFTVLHHTVDGKLRSKLRQDVTH
jgi:Nucleotidyl transferase AbiEii toxin, Type IV TA system